MRIKLTPAFVAKPPRVANDRAFYWDTTQSGFGLMVTAAGHRSFVVQYRGNEEHLTFLPFHPDCPPYYDDRRRTAVYDVDPHFLSRIRFDRVMVYVTLRCDFLLDTEGRAVDGNFRVFVVRCLPPRRSRLASVPALPGPASRPGRGAES